jgi:prepilin-type N-terminal cleavage/methylation domain-containing protein
MRYIRHKILRTKGFTLIELLVVIAIIGILASVILASLNASRTKAKDAAIISEMKQFEILLNLEYNESGSYAKLQTTNFYFVTSSTACDTAFPAPPTGSVYYDKARQICSSIVANVPPANGGTTGFFADTVSNQDNKYSIMAVLNNGPHSTTYYCLGSSGTSFDPGTLNSTGCWQRP